MSCVPSYVYTLSRLATHGAVLGENAHGAEHSAAVARNVGGHADVVPLAERDLLRRDGARVLEPTEVQ
jgi:hypothetical protein